MRDQRTYVKYRPVTNQETNWSLARMARCIRVWNLLTVIDREFILRRIRDKEPAIFYKIAQEK